MTPKTRANLGCVAMLAAFVALAISIKLGLESVGLLSYGIWPWGDGY